jgi:hypothetical protein
VTVDGKTLNTRPIRVRVRTSSAGSDVGAEITCKEDRLYVGQLVHLTLTVWVKPPDYGGKTMDPQNLYNLIDSRRNGFPPFPSAAAYDKDTRSIHGGPSQEYYGYRCELDYVMDKPGKPDFADMVVVVRYPQRFVRDVFGDVEPSELRPVRAKPELKIPNCEPLPAQGRPDDFTGAVGNVSISVDASPTKVRVGDPIELTLDLRGQGPIETFAAPNLAAQAELTNSFRVPSETLAGSVSGKRKRFTQVIRAKRPDVTQVPPIRYPYFDPTTGSYQVATSSAIPLRVEGTAQLESSDIAGAPPAAPDSNAAPQALDGLRGNKLDAAEVLKSAWEPGAAAAVAAVAVPAAGFGAAWLIGSLVQARGRNAGRKRARGAFRAAVARLDAASTAAVQPAAEIRAVLLEYLADRRGEPRGHFMASSGQQLLIESKVSQPARELFASCMQRSEAAAYAGGGAADAGLTADARRCLALLERERL